MDKKQSMQELVNQAATWGLAPLLVPGQKIIMTFKCPKCKGVAMIKLVKDADLRHKIWACKDCGFRKMSAGWIKRWGSFLTGTLDNQ